MGSIGNISNITNSISTKTFEEAVNEKKVADRRHNLAQLMYPAKKGTVLNITDSYSITKQGDERGALWKAPDGEWHFADDWVRILANAYKPTKKK